MKWPRCVQNSSWTVSKNLQRSFTSYSDQDREKGADGAGGVSERGVVIEKVGRWHKGQLLARLYHKFKSMVQTSYPSRVQMPNFVNYTGGSQSELEANKTLG